MATRTIRQITPFTVETRVRERVRVVGEDHAVSWGEVDRVEQRTEQRERLIEQYEPDPPVSNLADEVFWDPESNNCLDYACEELSKLAAAEPPVDLSQVGVVILESRVPGQPGHVGLLGPDGRFYDAFGVHDFDAWTAAHPELVPFRTGTTGDALRGLPAGDDFLAAMSLPPGAEREATLGELGLTPLLHKDLAFMPVLIALGVAALLLASCGPGPDTGPLVFDDAADVEAAIARGADLRGATFNFNVSGVNLNNLDLSGAHFPLGITDIELINSDLSGATFGGTIQGRFLGANLTGADFSGAIIDHSNFLYANLSGVDFTRAASVANTSFSFATLDAGTRVPFGIASCAYAGIPGGSPLLPHVPLNTPEVLLALTGTTDRAEQVRIVRELAASNALYPRLEALLPPGSFDAQLPPTFRSLLYEGIRERGINEFPLKSYIFDDVNEYWTSNYQDTRPAGGPTLSWLYETMPGAIPGIPPLDAVINDVLADALLSEQPMYLDAPVGAHVTAEGFNYAFAVNAGETPEQYARRTRDLLAVSDWGWNGATYRRGDILLPADIIEHALTTLDAATADRLRAIAADHIVSAQELADAGLFDAVMAVAYALRR